MGGQDRMQVISFQCMNVNRRPNAVPAWLIKLAPSVHYSPVLGNLLNDIYHTVRMCDSGCCISQKAYCGPLRSHDNFTIRVIIDMSCRVHDAIALACTHWSYGIQRLRVVFGHQHHIEVFLVPRRRQARPEDSGGVMGFFRDGRVHFRF